MSRAIQLTKIHALNWYGYRDSLPVKGNLVLAGVTGSGKSILMDLLMLVLVGPEKARHHFNRSATGSRSDRTIKGYCLLDTKREENGQAQYFHDKGVTTYIAAEFTWPDGERVETWGLRFEYHNTVDAEGTTTPFYCPEGLDREDFLIESEDKKKRPRGLTSFKKLMDQKGGRVYGSTRDYLREMAAVTHLNFNKEVLHRLLPSAMSFTNLKSFDDFCRQFVLPADPLQVDDVISSFRDFQSYERELKELKMQLTRLEQIAGFAAIVEGAERDREVASYLASEFACRHAQREVENVEERLKRLKDEYAGDEARFEALEGLIGEAQQRREHLSSLQNESSDGRLFKKLAMDLSKLEEEIERLRKLASRVDEGVGKRMKMAKHWIERVDKLGLQPLVDGSRVRDAIEGLARCERKETIEELNRLNDAADEVCRAVRSRFAKDADEVKRLRQEKHELEGQLDLLKKGISTAPQPLLSELQANLLVLPGQREPISLRDASEVLDEGWRMAIEVAMDDKYAVIVDRVHYRESVERLERMSELDLHRSNGQRLMAIEDLDGQKVERKKGSLAEKIRGADEGVNRCLDYLYGTVMCVDRLEEFHRHRDAIMASGMYKRHGVVIRSKPYDGVPVIGQGGLKKQLEVKRMRLGEVEAQLRRLEPLEQEIERVIAARQEELPDHQGMWQELIRVEDLEKKQDEHERLMADYQAISNDALSQIQDQLEDLKQQVGTWEQEKNAILRKGGHREIQHAEQQLADLKSVLNQRQEEWLKTQLRIDISKYIERYESWKLEMEMRYPFPGVAAKKFQEAADDAKETLLKTLGDLKVAMVEFKKTFHPKFDDLPDDGYDVAGYLKRLRVISEANIPEYEAKSAQERKRWEMLFRTQVLSRMQQALNHVENIISLLNLQLKRPIGHDRYRIERKPNPEFRIYRELIDLNTQHHEDELFFASMSNELRDALEGFLDMLVKNANGPEAMRLLDYRQYFDYDMYVSDIRDPDRKPVSVDKQSGKMSGGENQSPYFIAILASYLHAYNRHETRKKEPSLGLVPIDEAFSKLSGERIQNCIQAMSELDLQGMFSMSSGNIPYAFRQCDQLIVISRREERVGNRVGIRNVPVVLMKDSAEGQRWIREREANG